MRVQHRRQVRRKGVATFDSKNMYFKREDGRIWNLKCTSGRRSGI